MELGKLAKPGVFFDFTRYRPVISLRKGQREMSIPNVRIRYARTVDSFDFIFLHLMEPHMNGELYVDSLLRVLQRLDVRRYVLIGGMYDVVPHTRPLVVSGLATGRAMEDTLANLNIEASEYQGPTSITSLVFLEAAKLGIDTMGLMVHLPQYVQLEEDYTGAFQLLGILCSIYGISLDLEGVRRRGAEQYRQISLATEANVQLKQVVSELEEHYDAQEMERQKGGEVPQLSPEVEIFLQDVERRFRQGQ